MKKCLVWLLACAGFAPGMLWAKTWAGFSQPQWEHDLLRSTTMQVYGQAYYLRQHETPLLLRDFLSESAPDWVKNAQWLSWPTGLLLSGQTARLRWLLKVTALPNGTQWSWSAQSLRPVNELVPHPPWLPSGMDLMLSQNERFPGFNLTQQSYRYRGSLIRLQAHIAQQLQARQWQISLARPDQQRWVKENAELELLFHSVSGSSALYLLWREPSE